MASILTKVFSADATFRAYLTHAPCAVELFVGLSVGLDFFKGVTHYK